MPPSSDHAAIVLLVGCLALGGSAAGADEPTLERRFEEVVRPFLKDHCLACHGPKKQEGKLDLSGYTSAAAVVEEPPRLGASCSSGSRRRRCRPRRRRGSRRRTSARAVVAWIRRRPRPRGPAERGRPGPGPGPAAEQRRVRLHDPRPDRRRHPADARVPGRSRQRGRVRQLGRIADHVAGPAQEVPGGGAAGRRPPRPEAGRLRLRARTRPSPTPTATSTASGASSTSTSGTRSIYADYFLAAWTLPAPRGPRQAAGDPGRLRRRGRAERPNTWRRSGRS